MGIKGHHRYLVYHERAKITIHRMDIMIAKYKFGLAPGPLAKGQAGLVLGALEIYTEHSFSGRIAKHPIRVPLGTHDNLHALVVMARVRVKEVNKHVS